MKEIEALVDSLCILQGVGEKTATRYAYEILEINKEKRNNFINSLQDLSNIKRCNKCNGYTLNDICDICKENSYLNISDEITAYLDNKNIGYDYGKEEIVAYIHYFEVKITTSFNHKIHFQIKDKYLQYEFYDRAVKKWDNKEEFEEYHNDVLELNIIINDIEKMTKNY